MNINSEGKRKSTIVKLVIVIAVIVVIATLAAVFIPMITDIIKRENEKKANESADLQTMENINFSIEQALDEKPRTMYEALQHLASDGFSVESIKSKTGALLGWDEQMGRFVWIREEENDGKTVFRIVDKADPANTVVGEDEKYRYFIYLSDDGIYALSCFGWRDFDPEDYIDENADSYMPKDPELLLCGAAGCFDENGDLIRLGKIGGGYQLGCAWKQSSYSTAEGLSVSFSYWIGPENSDAEELKDTCGDGIALLFSQTCHSKGDVDIRYGVLSTDCAVEFVGFYDEKNPVQNNYFTVIHNNTHLVTETSDVIEDGKWHLARIEYAENALTVLIDTVPILSCTGIDLPESVYVGLTGGTGACTNNFFIRDYTVTSNQNENPETVYTENGLACTLSRDGTYYIVTGIGSCTDADLVIPTELNDKPVKEIGQAAFAGCNSLKSIEIPAGVTTVGGWAFANCTSLETVVLQEGVATVGERAFADCTALTDVAIPDSLRVISREMFCNCSSMKEIHLFGNVSAIGDYAFKGCTRLKIYSDYAIIHTSLPVGWSNRWNGSDCPFYRIDKTTDKYVRQN